MTTTTNHVGGTLRSAAAGAPAAPGIPMSRLIRVELRKLVDTRAGAWLLAALALATGAAIGVYLFVAGPSELTFAHFINVTVLPQSTLLSVLGIMAVTSEWTQRTGLVTHTLEPRRGRVLAAKYAATGILGALALVLALALAAGADLLGAALRHGDGSWTYGLDGLRDTVLFQAQSLLLGLALGTLLMNTAAAIVLYFVPPIAFTVLLAMVHSLTGAAPWIDLGTSQNPLLDHSISGVAWAQLLATSIWWILLPLGAGVWRLLHREIK